MGIVSYRGAAAPNAISQHVLGALGVLASCLSCQSPKPASVDTADSVVAPSESECDDSDGVERQSTLLIEVRGSDGAALSGARVMVDGDGHASGLGGGARFTNLKAGSHRLSVSLDGYVEQVRAVVLGDGAVHRVRVMLSRLMGDHTFLAGVGAVLVGDGIIIEIPPGAVEDIAGDPWDATVRARWGWVDGRDDPLGPRLRSQPTGAENGEGDTATVQTWGAISLSLTTPDGVPLVLRRGRPVVVRLEDVSGISSAVEDDVQFWEPGAVDGRLHEAMDVRSSAALEADGGRALELKWPRVGALVIGGGAAARHLTARVTCIDPDAVPTEVRIEASGFDEQVQLSSRNPALEFNGLPPGPVRATLVVNGQAVQSLTTDLSGPEPATIYLGPGDCGGIGVALADAAGCPVLEGTVVLVDDAGEVYDQKLAAGYVDFRDAPTGSWRVAFQDGAGGVTEASPLYSGPHGAELTLVLPTAGSSREGGGCLPVVCERDCDTCVDVLTLGDDGEPVGDLPVCSGDDVLVGWVDGVGLTCVDVDDGSGAYVVLHTEPGPMVSVPLGTGGRCDMPETCSQSVIWSEGIAASCSAGTRSALMQPVELSWADPAAGEAGQYEYAFGWSGTQIKAHVSPRPLPVPGGAGSVEISCTEGAFSALQRSSSGYALGARCVLGAGIGLELDLDLGEATAGRPLLISGGADAPRVSLRLIDRRTGATSRFVAVSGQVMPFQLSDSVATVRVNAVFNQVDGPLHGLRFSGGVATNLVSRADTPQRISSLRGHAVSQNTNLRVRTRSQAGVYSILTNGDIGWGGPIRGDTPPPAPCLPTDAPVVITATAGGQIPVGLTPSLRFDGVHLSAETGDGEVSSGWKIPQTVPRPDYALINRFFEVNELPPAAMARGTTVLLLMGLDDQVPRAATPGQHIGQVYLETFSGERRLAQSLGDDLRVTETDRVRGFALVDVPESDLDRPHVLHVLDLDGQEIPELQLSVAAVPGGVLVLGI